MDNDIGIIQATDWAPAISNDIVSIGRIVPPTISAVGGSTSTSSTEHLLQNPSPQILSGQEVTIMVSLDEVIKLDRSFQFRIVTTNWGIWVGTIKTGVQDD